MTLHIRSFNRKEGDVHGRARPLEHAFIGLRVVFVLFLYTLYQSCNLGRPCLMSVDRFGRGLGLEVCKLVMRRP